MSTGYECRACAAPLTSTFVDLGSSPLANAYRPIGALGEEQRLPLRVYVCDACKLVQLPEHQRPEEVFSEYRYFSSFSDSWLEHSRRFVEAIIERLALPASARIVEVASNDGYLLRYFVERGFPVLGIDPAKNVAEVAMARGVPTHVAFFGHRVAGEVRRDFGAADLLVANNVLAHVPDLNDFVAGVFTLLADDGVATFEFPHLVTLMEHVELDTIYHEHYSYLSLLSVEGVLQRHGLRVFDVEQLATHGGSLRLFVCRRGAPHAEGRGLAAVRQLEQQRRLGELETYRAFGARAEASKRAILRFLGERRSAGKRVAAYGAPAKATTLFNYCGVGPELIAFTVDRSPAKQGRTIPGTGIPILAPDELRSRAVDAVVILPWNLQREIATQLADLRARDVELSVLVPEPRVL